MNTDFLFKEPKAWVKLFLDLALGWYLVLCVDYWLYIREAVRTFEPERHFHVVEVVLFISLMLLSSAYILWHRHKHQLNRHALFGAGLLLVYQVQVTWAFAMVV